MSIQRICHYDVDVAEPGESVHTIAERMRQRTVGCLVIVNEFREPIGIVTDRDLVIRVLACHSALQNQPLVGRLGPAGGCC